MNINLDDLSAVSGLVTTALAIGAGVVLWMNRQRLNLGEVQVATNAERDRVIELQEQRIELLEQKVERLGRKIEWLEFENERLRDRSGEGEPPGPTDDRHDL